MYSYSYRIGIYQLTFSYSALALFKKLHCAMTRG